MKSNSVQFFGGHPVDLTQTQIILDEYWQNHPELHDVPIYYASSLAKKCMSGTKYYCNIASVVSLFNKRSFGIVRVLNIVNFLNV